MQIESKNFDGLPSPAGSEIDPWQETVVLREEGDLVWSQLVGEPCARVPIAHSG